MTMDGPIEKKALFAQTRVQQALDAGAHYIDADDVREALEAKGYTFASAEAQYIPSTTATLSDADDLKKMGLLLDALEDNDDVQNVWHSLENEEDLPE